MQRLIETILGGAVLLAFMALSMLGLAAWFGIT